MTGPTSSSCSRLHISRQPDSFSSSSLNLRLEFFELYKGMTPQPRRVASVPSSTPFCALMHLSRNARKDTSHRDPPSLVSVHQVLYSEEGAVRGIATNDMGVAKDGSRKDSFQRGMELRGEACGELSRVIPRISAILRAGKRYVDIMGRGQRVAPSYKREMCSCCPGHSRGEFRAHGEPGNAFYVYSFEEL